IARREENGLRFRRCALQRCVDVACAVLTGNNREHILLGQRLRYARRRSTDRAFGTHRGFRRLGGGPISHSDSSCVWEDVSQFVQRASGISGAERCVYPPRLRGGTLASETLAAPFLWTICLSADPCRRHPCRRGRPAAGRG